MKRLLFPLLLIVTVSVSAQEVPHTATASMFRPGYDIPAGVEHGTWDFDEWPGVDHPVVYYKNFRYGEPHEKTKIDYTLSVFDGDDHTGYMRTPEALSERFNSLDAELQKARNIVAVFAHPDDEVLLAGGFLARAASMGKNVRVVLLSNGSDGSRGFDDDESETLGGYNCASIMPDGSVRVATDLMGLAKPAIARRYGKVLGVDISILPVRYELDGETIVQIGEYPGLDFKKSYGPGTVMREAMQRSIEGLVSRERPDMVVTHGSNGEYGSYFHKTISLLVKNAVLSTPSRGRIALFTGFPEYNTDDRITHFLDLDAHGGDARRKKHEAFKRIEFIYREGNDYDKPWNPDDDYMDGMFVKDYGYTPVTGKPPRYEFFQKVDLGGTR